MFGFWKKQRAERGLPKALEERLDAWERRVRALELEWENTFDKIQRIVGRLNARAKEQMREVEEVEREPQPAGDFDRLTAMRRLREKKHGLL